MPDFASISASLDAIAAGSLIVVVDDDSETATGALAGAAQFMDTEKLVWLSRRVTGLIGVPMSVDRADELELELIVFCKDSHWENKVSKGEGRFHGEDYVDI